MLFKFKTSLWYQNALVILSEDVIIPHQPERAVQKVLNLMGLKEKLGASLVAQWLRICLPMQGTRVRALVWEDPTCRGATRPVSHNY